MSNGDGCQHNQLFSSDRQQLLTFIAELTERGAFVMDLYWVMSVQTLVMFLERSSLDRRFLRVLLNHVNRRT
ncbi:unnamed protein product [Toxocara canis]|uniref:Transcriptional regulator n=1 Tax=Toxocara canis TaxID=6265 RepID=A0A183UPC1_TOXCA|nr:unnamed protein product [Toxocara canis]